MLKLFFALLLLFSNGANAATISVTDSRGEQNFSAIPQKVIALDWATVENLIALEITPLAIADTTDYRTWVRRPTLPDSVIDVGTRDAPNIERIAQLQPDLIIIGAHQKALLNKLETIAPVLMFKNFSRDHDNAEVAKQTFHTLATLFNKQALAQQQMADLDNQLAQWKKQLHDHYDGNLPKVSTVRFNNTALVWVYGDNSMPQFALQKLGINPALSQPATQWGVTQKKIVELASINQGILLYFEPFAQKEVLFASPLWKAMPFVRQQRFAPLPATWTYGGVLSIRYLAEAITKQLLSIEP